MTEQICEIIIAVLLLAGLILAIFMDDTDTDFSCKDGLWSPARGRDGNFV